MNRLLVLLVLVSLCEGHFHLARGYRYTHHHHPWHYRRHDRRFDRLASHVIAADRYLQGFCRENANSNAYDLYESQGYKLVYTIPQCSFNYISVKIKHRVLYMSAKQITRYHPETFADMRILPDLLKLDEASWTYDAGKLEILFPYRKDFKTQWEKTCGSIDGRVIVVPQYGFQFRNRFGEGDADGDATNGTEATDSTEDPSNVPDTGTDSYDTVVFDLLNVTSTTTAAPDNDRLIFST